MKRLGSKAEEGGASGRIAVGEAARPQGLKGALRVRPWLDDFAAYRAIEAVFVQGASGQRLEVESLKRGGKGVLVWKFRGIDSVEAAEGLRGAVFLADRGVLRGADEDVYYWEDFEGLDVVDASGRLLGRMENLIGARENEILVVRSPEGEEILLPATREVVLRREPGRLIVRPPVVEDAGGEEGGDAR